MGLTQSIHDINIINANNGTDEQIPISNIQSMSNSLNNMQQRYNLIPSQNLKNMNYSTRNTNTYQKTIQINNYMFNLNIWDTAGEEKYHAMAPIFYRGAHGAVVIFDVTNRETFKRATKWFSELSEFTEGRTKIILVGNKIDLPNRVISNEEASELAKKYKCDFLEVSALLGKNVDEIFNSLSMTIYQGNKRNSLDSGNDNGRRSSSSNIGNNRNRKFNITQNIDSVAENRKGGCCT